MKDIFEGFYQFRCVKFELFSIVDNGVAIKTWKGNTLFD